MAVQLDENTLRGVVDEVLARLGKTPTPAVAPTTSKPSTSPRPKPTSPVVRGGKHYGVFENAAAATAAAAKAFEKLREKGVAARCAVVDAPSNGADSNSKKPKSAGSITRSRNCR